MASSPPRSLAAVRAVILDLDDTLCNTIESRPARARAAFEWLAAQEPRFDADHLTARFEALVTHPRAMGQMAQLLQEIGVYNTPLGHAAWNVFVRTFAGLRLFPEAPSTLNWLKANFQLGMITNADPADQIPKVKHLGIDDYIEPRLIVYSGAFGRQKPDPGIFHHTLELLGLRPHEAVMVGDRLEADIAGANAVDMPSIWFNHWRESLDDASPRPDFTITRLTELTTLLPTGAQR